MGAEYGQSYSAFRANCLTGIVLIKRFIQQIVEIDSNCGH